MPPKMPCMKQSSTPLSDELRALTRQVQAQLTHAASPFALAPQPYADGSSGWRFAQAPQHVAHWLDAGRAHVDAPFIHYWHNGGKEAKLPSQPEVWRYADFYALVDTWAAWLPQHTGLAAGERVAILSANSPQWVAAFAASVYAGAVVAPLNSMNTALDAVQTLAELQPKLLFADAARWQALQVLWQAEPEAFAALPACTVLLLGAEVGDTSTLPTGWRVLALPAADARSPAAQAPAASAQADALIVYTSGSAARPKGAVFSHDAVCQALMNLEYIGAFAAMTSPAALQKIMAAGHAPCLLSCVPYFHVSGLYAQVLSTLKNGRKLVLLPRWQAAQALHLIEHEKVTAISAAPTMVAQLMALPEFGEAEVTGSLTAIGFGGSAIPPALQQAAQERLAETLCGTGFGMTETGGAGAGASGAVFLHNPASAGLLSPIMQVRIEDDNGQALPTGEAGEICLRGPTLMRGYWQQEEASAQALRGGWMHTGDWGYADADSYLYIPGRIKEVINRHGEKIAASEVEACLASHPAVQEVAVIALPDADSLERVAACVVPKGDALLRFDEDELLAQWQAHAAAHLPAYKVPTAWALHPQPLPRNAMQKVVKGGLAACFTSAS